MGEAGDARKDYFQHALSGLSVQAVLHEKMAQSQVMRRYVAAIEKNMSLMREAISVGDFETLVDVETAIQIVELEKYSHDAGMMASIQKTQKDLAEGMKDYRQLIEMPEAYCARGYRERDCVGANKEFPLDTMRKALRSQAVRVDNFAKNSMLFPVEKEFHLLRVSLLKRAEKLYEGLQAQAIAANGKRSR